MLSNSNFQNGRRLFFLMTVGVGKPATCFRVTAALSMPGSLGAWFESHYNPVMQVLYFCGSKLPWLSGAVLLWFHLWALAGQGYYSALAMQMHTSPLTPMHLHRIMAEIPDPAYKKPINPRELLLNRQQYLTVNPGCKLEQTVAQMLFSHTS